MTTEWSSLLGTALYVLSLVFVAGGFYIKTNLESDRAIKANEEVKKIIADIIIENKEFKMSMFAENKEMKNDINSLKVSIATIIQQLNFLVDKKDKRND